MQKRGVFLLLEHGQLRRQLRGGESFSCFLVRVDREAKRPIVRVAHAAKSAGKEVLLCVRRVETVEIGAFDCAHTLIFFRTGRNRKRPHPCPKQGTVCSSPGVNAGVSQTGGSDELFILNWR